QRVEELERFYLAALEVEREGRARAEAVALVDVGLTRAFLEEAEVADLLHLRVAAQEVADLGGILAGAVHPQLQRLEAAEQHPGGVRVADRADRVPEHPNLIDQPFLTDDAAGDEVAMATDIFGEAV